MISTQTSIYTQWSMGHCDRNGMKKKNEKKGKVKKKYLPVRSERSIHPWWSKWHTIYWFIIIIYGLNFRGLFTLHVTDYDISYD